jgi:SP family myo-inositol transporter-like MFS transporter 13
MDKITPAGAFGFYAGLCLLGWIFVLGCFPETAGLSLEEVKMVFRNGFGIKESQRLRRRKQEIQERDKGRLKALDDVSMRVERQVGGDNEKI